MAPTARLTIREVRQQPVLQITAGVRGPIGPRQPLVATYSDAGTITATPGSTRYYFTSDATITNVLVSVNTAPTGQALIVDINVNGTTIYTNQAGRPTIPAGQFVSLSSTPDITAVTAGDYMTVDVDQVGSGVVGSDLVVQIEYE